MGRQLGGTFRQNGNPHNSSIAPVSASTCRFGVRCRRQVGQTADRRAWRSEELVRRAHNSLYILHDPPSKPGGTLLRRSARAKLGTALNLVHELIVLLS